MGGAAFDPLLPGALPSWLGMSMGSLVWSRNSKASTVCAHGRWNRRIIGCSAVAGAYLAEGPVLRNTSQRVFEVDFRLWRNGSVGLNPCPCCILQNESRLGAVEDGCRKWRRGRREQLHSCHHQPDKVTAKYMLTQDIYTVFLNYPISDTNG